MIGYPRSTNNRVINNRVEGPAMRHGVLLQYSAHHNLVESNTVVRTTYDAFDLHGEDEYGNELRSNVAENCGEGGFGSATRLQPRERRTGHLGPPQPGDRLQVGIHVYRKSNTQLIEDNEFCRNASHGIYVQDGGARERTIARNTVLGNGSDGIRLITAPSVVVIGNQVHNNT